jgi:nitric oxide reductase NorD protein
MEEFVGGLWHKFITGVAERSYPQAAVNLAEVEKTVGIFFRALGGDAGLRIAAASSGEHHARRRWLQRLAGSGERAAPARIDGITLRLPPQLAAFPERSLNRDLYLWLAALAASNDTVAADDEAGLRADDALFRRNQRATAHALAAFPGLAGRYQKLVAAHLAERPRFDQLPAEEEAQEQAIRAALRQPGSVAALPPLTARNARPAQPVPLWLAPALNTQGSASGDDDALPAEGGGNNANGKVQAHRAERTEMPDNESPFILMFRAESILSWAEYVRVNRAIDEEPNPDAADAAAEMNQLSLVRDGQTTASRVRFDLDLPSAAEDDRPVGPGIKLPEWDYRTALLQPEHVLLQPLLARDAEPAPLPPHLQGLARRLRGQFAALVPQRRWLKAQPDGPEIDVDAWVRVAADRAAGVSPDGGAYLSQVRCERDLACLLLADLSLSTDASISDSHRIVDVVKESLLLFSEAMSATGDRFGLYGFSSLKRHNVRFHLIKDFAAPYDAAARGRILALKPGYYTRMGAAIRQASRILVEQPAGRRLLLILTDGKPNDLDIYDSRYGIEDTRMAVHEARQLGLQPFCVTIDHEGAGYLPHLFGPAGFTVIRRPEELPRRLPLLYAQLTRN